MNGNGNTKFNYDPPMLKIVFLSTEDVLTGSNEVGVQWDNSWNDNWGEWGN